MAVHLDYDTDKRIIYVTTAPTNGVVTLDAAIDIYSDMKEDWRIDANLGKLKFPLAEPVGGNAVTPTKSIGSYYFLKYGWYMRPYEADHTLYIENGFLLIQGGGDPWIPTLGGYTVNVRDSIPSDAFVLTAQGNITEEDKNDIVDKVWDEPLTGASHNTPTSAGRRLRDVASSVIHTGTAVSSTDNTIVLNGDASTVDGAYDPALIAIVNGTGFGQTRLVFQYEGSTKTALVDRNWKVNPDNTSEYAVIAHPGREHVNEGRAQAGTLNTITLNTLASDQDDAYIGQVVFIRSGTGEDQALRVTAYNGTTKVATMCENWGITPDNTSGYVMLAGSIMKGGHIADAVWDKVLP